MTETSEKPPRLGRKFVEALEYAARLHATQTRKGSGVPYVGHLLSVAALVMEDGGSETEAIAALLHDGPEDQGGEPTLAEIRQRYGDGVDDIVSACSDTFEDPKPPWQTRKEAYLEHLRHAEPGALRVSLADKLDNSRAILRDFRAHGDALWERFSTGSGDHQLWYYSELAAIFAERSDSPMADELERVVAELRALVSASRAGGS